MEHKWTFQCTNSPNHPTTQPDIYPPKKVRVVFPPSQRQVWDDGMHACRRRWPTALQLESAFIAGLEVIPVETSFLKEERFS